MVKKFVGVPVEAIIRSGGYKLLSPLSNTSALLGHGAAVDSLTRVAIRETWKVPTLHRFSWGNPVQLVRALPTHAPTSRDIVLGVLGTLALYDFLFFVPHIAMHKVRGAPFEQCGA